jgi:hypothetical protein
VSSFMSTNKCINLCSQCYRHMKNISISPKRSLVSPVNVPPTPVPRQPLIYFLLLLGSLHFLEFQINEVIQWVLAYVCLFFCLACKFGGSSVLSSDPLCPILTSLLTSLSFIQSLHT